MKTELDRYTLVTRVLHWLMVFLVLTLFGLGQWMSDLDYYHSWYQRAPSLHVSLGVLFAVLLSARIVNRVLSPVPGPLATWARFERLVSKVLHYAFYVLMLGMAVTGYLLAGLEHDQVEVFQRLVLPSVPFDRSLEDGLHKVHEVVAAALIVLACVHGLAALKHHFYNRDLTLRRIKPW